MRFRGTLAARVGLLVTVAVGLAVAFVSAAAFAMVRHEMFAALDTSLVERAKSAARTDQVANTPGPRAEAWVLGAADVKVAFVSADGVVGYVDPEPGEFQVKPTRTELAVARGLVPSSTRTAYTEDGPYRVAAVPTDPGVALMLGESLDTTHDALERLGFVLALFGLLGMVGAGFAGWAVARNGLRPVRRLTEAVEEIARTERLDPIAVEGNDEVARLASGFNAMLAALAGSRTRQRQLVADAGHELRTPLTSLRTNLELLAQADQRGGLSEESRVEMMEDVRFQIEELTTLIGDLTELARDEPIPGQLVPVDLAEVVERALDRVRRRATSLHFDVALEPWEVTGEPASLERAVTNLLDNAAKWSPPLGVVTVRLGNGTLYVADQGKGIAEEDLPHVFERFYRSSESRTMPGSGLGLSIVRNIAERHGGAVCAGNTPEGGAAFWFMVPGKSKSAPSEISASAQQRKGPWVT
jgi:two-component system sensor histidine kinase MprB